MNFNFLKNFPWQFKLIILVLFLGIVPSLLVSYKVVQFVKDEFKSSINSQLIFSTEELVSNIDYLIQKNRETATIIKQTVENPNLLPEQKLNIISSYVKESENIISIELILKEKSKLIPIITTYKDEIKKVYNNIVDLLQSNNYINEIKSKYYFFSTPNYYRNLSLWSSWIILPIKLDSNKDVFLSIQINLNSLEEKLKKHFINKIGQIIVLDANQEIFLSKNLTENYSKKILSDAVLQLGKKNKVNLINNYQFDNKNNFVASFGYPNEVNWVVVGIIDENSAYATVNDFIIFISLFISISTILSLIISIIFSKLVISKPIEQLAFDSKNISNGNFYVPIKYKAKDSIGLLNTSLHQMGLQLQKNFQEIEYQRQQLEDYSKNLEKKVLERTRELHEANLELKKAYQKVLELNEEKNEFLGIAAHDLKNPLTAVSAFADILINDKDLSKEQHDDFLNEIIKASERMFFIVKNLLDVNAIEQGKLNTKIEPISLNSVIDDISNQFKESLSKKNILLIKNIEIENPFVLADYNLTLQVVQNILSNAIKFSQPNKNITLSIKNSSFKDMIDLSIKDEGPGFTEEDKKKLFKKFSRLSARPTGGEHSTGLGLSIVKKLIEMMDGKINLMSEHGKGAEFIISFSKAK